MTTPLARELKRQNLTVTVLANRTGLDRKYLYMLRDGTRHHPSWPFVLRISHALRVKPETLFPIRYADR